MKTKTYPIVCKSCNGSGYMNNPNFDPNVTETSTSVICKACNGSGIVIVTETEK